MDYVAITVILVLLVYVSLAVSAWNKGRRGHFWIPAIGLPIAGAVMGSAFRVSGMEGVGVFLVGALVGLATLLLWLIALTVAVVRRPRARGDAAAERQKAAERQELGTCPRCGTFNAWGKRCATCGSSLVWAADSDQKEPAWVSEPHDRLEG